MSLHRLLPFALALLLAACATGPLTQQAVQRGELDTREYRYLELPNRLHVLLVSDSSTDQSAASLRVEIGSGDDPRDRQGLAHFLEHMLFLGTAKYPQADEYQDFINAHGGNHNAYTALDHTNYFFDISPDSLEPALDRFAQFFVAPLFSAEYVQREVNAVDSEYRMGLKDDPRREYDVLRELVQPEHPLAQLAVGNLETLGPTRGDIRGELVAFHERRYSANLMTLAVLGREPLDALQAMVESRFGAIADRDARARSEAPELFAPGSLPLEVRIRPEKELRELSLTFPVPSAHTRYAAKPLEYIGNLLGHEGPGSLLSVLKSRGWVESLGAGAGFDLYGSDLFQVSVNLTEAGLEHRGEIIGLTLQAIADLHSRGVEEWRYREQGELADLGFRFREKGSPAGTALGLANALHDYPPAEVLRGPYLYADYDRALILDYLQRMRADNLLVTFSAKGVATDRSSRWFDTPYAVSRLDAASLERVADPALAAALALPEANEFVPRSVATKPPEQAPPRPLVLREERGYRLWHLQDAEFPGPRASVYFQLLAPGANDSPLQTALGALFARLVQDELNEFTYPATLAGLQYGVTPSARGLAVKISGYDDRQAVLLDKILGSLAQQRFAADRFASLKAELIREWGNSARERPVTQLIDGLGNTLVRRSWSDAELLAALAPADPAALEQYVLGLRRQAAVEMLVHGNFQRGEAVAIGARARDALRGSAAGEVPALEVREIPPGEYARAYPIEHPDSALLMYLQGSAADEAERGRIALSGQILGPIFFNELRTERQLGYVVFAQPYPLARAPGLLLAVQSPVMDPAGLAGEFTAFLERQEKALAKLSEEEYARHRLALVERLRETPKSLNEKSERLWGDLGLGSYGFDDRERVAAAVERIGREEWVSYFRERLAGPGRRGLLLYSKGSAPAGAAPGRVPGLPVDTDPHWWSDAKYYRFDWPVSVQDAERALHL